MNEIQKLVDHLLYRCDEADYFGDDIETSDVRLWIKEYEEYIVGPENAASHD